MSTILKVRPRTSQEIEGIAHEIIKSFQPEALRFVTSFNVEGFFDYELQNRTGIEAIHEPLGERIEGYTDSVNRKCYISLNLVEYGDCQVTKRRLRSTLAHEIGHCYLHVDDARENQRFQQTFWNDDNSKLEMYRPEDIEIYENAEWQAWRFASALLMPENCFRVAVSRNFTLKQMKRVFDVNPAFIRVRMKELKISKQLRNG